MAQDGTENFGRPEVEDAPTVNDNASATVKEMLATQDALINAMKALTAKMDADSGGGGETNYAALITDALEKVKFIG